MTPAEKLRIDTERAFRRYVALRNYYVEHRSLCARARAARYWAEGAGGERDSAMLLLAAADIRRTIPRAKWLVTTDPLCRACGWTVEFAYAASH